MSVLPELSAEEVERYARHVVLRDVGGPGQRKLKAANVCVVGAGGSARLCCFIWPRRAWGG